MKRLQSSYLKSETTWTHFLNASSGLFLRIFSPFKVGDIIEVKGHLGTVINKGWFTFKILTSEDKELSFANKTVYQNGISNLTTKNMMRLDLNVEVKYDSNMTQVKDTLMGILRKNELVLSSPSPKISISGLRDQFIDLTLTPWCEPDDYWSAYNQLHYQLLEGLKAKGVTTEIKPAMVELRKVI